MAGGLTLDEQELHFNRTGDNPNTWFVFCSLETWWNRLEKAGAVLTKEHKTKEGEVYAKEYTLRNNQVGLRKGEKKPVSEAQRAASRERMREIWQKRKKEAGD